MKWLDEIRGQSKGVREIMFFLCVVITISFVGYVWFQSFEKKIFVTLNPNVKLNDQRYFAGGTPSLFSSLGKMMSDSKALILDSFQKAPSIRGFQEPATSPMPLPLPDNRGR